MSWSLSAGTAPLTPTAPTTRPVSTSGTPPLPNTNSYWPSVATLSANSMRFVKRSSRSRVVARKPAAAFALARAISGVTQSAPPMRSHTTRCPASSTTAMATLKPSSCARLRPRSTHARARSRVIALTTGPPRSRHFRGAPDTSVRTRRGRETRTGRCGRRTSSRAMGTPVARRTACPHSAGRPCARRRRRGRAPGRRCGRVLRASRPPQRAWAVRPSRRPARQHGSPSQLLFQDVRAMQAAHVLPAHLGRLPHLLQRLRALVGRVRVAFHDLVAALAVHLVGFDVDREELHLAVVEAVLARERREIALVDAGDLRLQADQEARGGDVERLPRRLEAPCGERARRRQLACGLDVVAAHPARLAETNQQVDVLGARFFLDDVLQQEIPRVGVRTLGVHGGTPARKLRHVLIMLADPGPELLARQLAVDPALGERIHPAVAGGRECRPLGLKF